MWDAPYRNAHWILAQPPRPVKVPPERPSLQRNAVHLARTLNHGGHGEHGGKTRIEEKHVGVKSKPGAEVTSDGQV
jgi:hypothetical protein